METSEMIEMNLKPDGKNESSKKKEPPKGFQEIFQSFIENTTIPAITLINIEINIIWKYIWLIIVIGSLGSAFYQTVEILKNYYSHPSYLTEVEIRNTSIFMPSLTLCAHNTVNWKNVKQTNHSLLYTIENEAGELRKKYGSEFDVRVKIRELLMKEVNAMKEEEQKKILVNVTDWLLHCSVSDAESKTLTLDTKWFRTFSYSPALGTCITINPGLEESSKLRMGKSSGIIIVAEINPEIEFPYLDDIPGLGLSIHPAGTAPAFPWQKTLEILPGELVQIGIKVKDIERLPSPYASKCVNDLQELSKEIYDSPYQRNETSYSYSTEECLATCISQVVRKTKECYLSNIPINKITRSQNVNLCNELDLRDTLIKAEKQCSHSCRKRCRELLYDWIPKSTILSERSGFLMDALKKFNKGGITNISNFVIIIISLDSTGYIYAKETPKYELEDVFGFIGGNFGLWIGLSFLSLFEIIELFINLVINIISKMRN